MDSVPTDTRMDRFDGSSDEVQKLDGTTVEDIGCTKEHRATVMVEQAMESGDRPTVRRTRGSTAKGPRGPKTIAQTPSATAPVASKTRPAGIAERGGGVRRADSGSGMLRDSAIGSAAETIASARTELGAQGARGDWTGWLAGARPPGDPPADDPIFTRPH